MSARGGRRKIYVQALRMLWRSIAYSLFNNGGPCCGAQDHDPSVAPVESSRQGKLESGSRVNKCGPSDFDTLCGRVRQKGQKPPSCLAICGCCIE